MRLPISSRCERAREWASLRVDGELSDLERRLLADHLRRCADCAAFAADVEASTRALRSTPLASVRVSLALPRRRRRLRARPVQLAAAGAVAATLAAATVGIQGTHGHALQPPRVHPPTTPDDFVGVQQARRAQLLGATHYWVSRLEDRAALQRAALRPRL